MDALCRVEYKRPRYGSSVRDLEEMSWEGAEFLLLKLDEDDVSYSVLSLN